MKALILVSVPTDAPDAWFQSVRRIVSGAKLMFVANCDQSVFAKENILATGGPPSDTVCLRKDYALSDVRSFQLRFTGGVGILIARNEVCRTFSEQASKDDLTRSIVNGYKPVDVAIEGAVDVATGTKNEPV